MEIILLTQCECEAPIIIRIHVEKTTANHHNNSPCYDAFTNTLRHLYVASYWVCLEYNILNYDTSFLVYYTGRSEGRGRGRARGLRFCEAALNDDIDADACIPLVRISLVFG